MLVCTYYSDTLRRLDELLGIEQRTLLSIVQPQCLCYSGCDEQVADSQPHVRGFFSSVSRHGQTEALRE